MLFIALLCKIIKLTLVILEGSLNYFAKHQQFNTIVFNLFLIFVNKIVKKCFLTKKKLIWGMKFNFGFLYLNLLKVDLSSNIHKLQSIFFRIGFLNYIFFESYILQLKENLSV